MKVGVYHRLLESELSCCHILHIVFHFKERPGTEVWVDLDKRQIPLLLNYAQCKLQKGETGPCINHCTEVLEKIDGNVSAKFIANIFSQRSIYYD